MGENLFCAGQAVVTDEYRDGITRIKEGYPKIGKPVKKMLNDWVAEEDYEKIYLFFLGKCKFSTDYSEFLTREAIRGYLCQQ